MVSILCIQTCTHQCTEGTYLRAQRQAGYTSAQHAAIHAAIIPGPWAQADLPANWQACKLKYTAIASSQLTAVQAQANPLQRLVPLAVLALAVLYALYLHYPYAFFVILGVGGTSTAYVLGRMEGKVATHGQGKEHQAQQDQFGPTNQERLIEGIHQLQATIQAASNDEDSMPHSGSAADECAALRLWNFWLVHLFCKDCVLGALSTVLEGNKLQHDELLVLYDAFRRDNWGFETNHTLMSLQKHVEIEADIEGAISHLLGQYIHSPSGYVAAKQESCTAGQLLNVLHEVTPGLLPFDVINVHGEQNGQESFGAHLSVNEPRRSGSIELSLSAMLANLTANSSPCLDHIPSSRANLSDNKLPSPLHAALPRIHSRRHNSSLHIGKARSLSISNLPDLTEDSSKHLLSAPASVVAGSQSQATSSMLSLRSLGHGAPEIEQSKNSLGESLKNMEPVWSELFGQSGSPGMAHLLPYGSRLGLSWNPGEGVVPDDAQAHDGWLAGDLARSKRHFSATSLQSFPVELPQPPVGILSGQAAIDYVLQSPINQARRFHRAMSSEPNSTVRGTRASLQQQDKEEWLAQASGSPNSTPHVLGRISILPEAEGRAPQANGWYPQAHEEALSLSTYSSHSTHTGCMDNKRCLAGHQSTECTSDQEGVPNKDKMQEHDTSGSEYEDASGAVQTREASWDDLGQVHKTEKQGGGLSRPRAAPKLEVEFLLDKASTSFSFNAFQLATVTQNHPLSTLGYFLLHKSGLISHFKIKGIVLARFLRAIEDGYSSNVPYHNATHAADVLQTLHVILHHGNVSSQLEPLLHLAAYIAAIVHDFDHGGLTNDFLRNTHNPLAIRYNDVTILENHHLAAAFGVLLKSEHNFLSDMLLLDYTRLRKAIIDLVLATDMKQHFSLVHQGRVMLRLAGVVGSCPSPNDPQQPFLVDRSSFDKQSTVSHPSSPAAHQATLCRTPISTASCNWQNIDVSSLRSTSGCLGERKSKATSSMYGSHESSIIGNVQDSPEPGQGGAPVLEPPPAMSSPPVDEGTGLVQTSLNHEQRLLFLQLVLKCADLGHVAEDLEVHLRWVRCLEEEFWRQGDREKERGLPLSPLFDRDKQGVTKSQVGFLDVVVLPLFKILVAAVPGAQPLLAGAECNQVYWMEIQKQDKPQEGELSH